MLAPCLQIESLARERWEQILFIWHPTRFIFSILFFSVSVRWIYGAILRRKWIWVSKEISCPRLATAPWCVLKRKWRNWFIFVETVVFRFLLGVCVQLKSLFWQTRICISLMTTNKMESAYICNKVIKYISHLCERWDRFFMDQPANWYCCCRSVVMGK